MSRPLRVEIPGGWYHLTSRGNENRTVFWNDGDRRHFVKLLEESVGRFRWLLHTWTLMDNHDHLIVETPQANLSRGMHWLGVSYTAWFNARRRRAGHLFQGRFQAIVMDSPEAWAVSRYVHLNAVRITALGMGKADRDRGKLGLAGPVDPVRVRQRLEGLREYRWSSYRAYVGLEPSPNWLTTAAILAMGPKRRRKEQPQDYKAYVEEPLREGTLESPRERLQGGLLLGEEEFVEEMKQLLRGDKREQPSANRLLSGPSWEQIVREVERVKGEKWGEFRDRYGDWSRDMALYAGQRLAGMRLKELAINAGGLDYGSGAGALLRFRRRLEKDAARRGVYERLKTRLIK